MQFDTLFTDDLYFKLAKHANAEADKIRKALFEKHYDIEYISQTNQIFIVVTTQRAQELTKSVKLGFMEQVDADHVMLRICTSWGYHRRAGGRAHQAALIPVTAGPCGFHIRRAQPITISYS